MPLLPTTTDSDWPDCPDSEEEEEEVVGPGVAPSVAAAAAATAGVLEAMADNTLLGLAGNTFFITETE